MRQNLMKNIGYRLECLSPNILLFALASDALSWSYNSRDIWLAELIYFSSSEQTV